MPLKTWLNFEKNRYNLFLGWTASLSHRQNKTKTGRQILFNDFVHVDNLVLNVVDSLIAVKIAHAQN